MVPNFAASLKRSGHRLAALCAAMAQAWRAQARLLAWIGLAWLLGVCLPRALLATPLAADVPAVRVLLALPPLAALAAAAAWQRPWLTAMTGLGACISPLVAVPLLVQTPLERPWTSLALAVALLGAVDAAARIDHQGGGLLSLWPQRWTRRMVALGALGMAWLAMAWWLPVGGQGETVRALRTVAAGACWSLLLVPKAVAPAGPASRLATRRLLWLVLLAGLWWVWRRGA